MIDETSGALAVDMVTGLRYDLEERVAKLAALRAESTAARLAWSAKTESLTAEHRPLVDRIDALRLEMETVEAEVRAFALLVHDATTDKKPAPGVSIAITTECRINEPEALAWATEKGMALKPATVDLAAIKKLALSGAVPMPFVELLDRPVVRIATNLGGGE
jgi:hypothetical protein